MLAVACEPEKGREQEHDAPKLTRSAKLGCSKCRYTRKGCTVCRAKAGLTPLPKRLSVSPRKCAIALEIPWSMLPYGVA